MSKASQRQRFLDVISILLQGAGKSSENCCAEQHSLLLSRTYTRWLQSQKAPTDLKAANFWGQPLMWWTASMGGKEDQ